MAMVLRRSRLRLTQAIYFGNPANVGSGTVTSVGAGNGITADPESHHRNRHPRDHSARLRPERRLGRDHPHRPPARDRRDAIHGRREGIAHDRSHGDAACRKRRHGRRHIRCGYIKSPGGVGNLTSQAVPIPLADGGTGAVALAAGYVKSTGAVMASQTIPIPVGDGGTGTTAGFIAGSVVVASGTSAYTQDNANFFYDLVNHRLGLKNATPTRELDIAGVQRQRGIAAPPVSELGSGTIYFDTALNKYRVSLNGGAYVDLVGSAGLTGSGVAGKLAYWTAATTMTDEPNITLGGTYTLDVNGDLNLDTSANIIRVAGLPVLQADNANNNISVGSNAGGIAPASGSTAVGVQALQACSGADNTGIGSGALVLLGNRRWQYRRRLSVFFLPHIR